MKTQTKFFTAAAASTIAGLVSATPAQAISFGSDFIRGDGTKVDFTFLESHGAFQSRFGILNYTTGNEYDLFEEVLGSDGKKLWATDHKGSCGIAVLNCKNSFTFESGNDYAFYLKSTYNNKATKTVYSVNALNPVQHWATFQDQAKFFLNLNVLDDATYGTKDSLTSNLATTDGETINLRAGLESLIAFEDQGISSKTGEYFHGDWNDFIVSAKAHEEVPEPITGLAIAAAGGGVALRRAKKKKKNSKQN